MESFASFKLPQIQKYVLSNAIKKKKKKKLERRFKAILKKKNI